MEQYSQPLNFRKGEQDSLWGVTGSPVTGFSAPQGPAGRHEHRSQPAAGCSSDQCWRSRGVGRCLLHPQDVPCQAEGRRIGMWGWPFWRQKVMNGQFLWYDIYGKHSVGRIKKLHAFRKRIRDNGNYWGSGRLVNL
jgi:hypothetical protein